MRTPKKYTIDGTRYLITCLPARKSLEVYTFITKLVAEPLLMLAARGIDRFMDGNVIDYDVAAMAVKSLTSQLTNEEMLKLTRDLMEGIELDEKSEDGDALDLSNEDDFDTHFQGRLLHLMKVLQAGIEENYHDFFDAFRSLKSKAPSKA